jgi:hypothetical protein
MRIGQDTTSTNPTSAQAAKATLLRLKKLLKTL